MEPVRVRIEALAMQRCGRRVVDFEEIEPGLGQRRFFRIRLEGDDERRLVARVEPDTVAAPATREPLLTPILRCLHEAGLPVPALAAADDDESIVLLEDVGRESLEGAVRGATPERRRSLYAEAVDLVPRLQAVVAPRSTAGAGPDVEAFRRRLDAALIATKAEKFCRLSLPVLLGRAVREAERACVTAAFDAVAAEAMRAPARLAHRDFKAANLHLRPGADGAPHLCMIDIQGAFMAPPEYDLVCLLRDSHVLLPEEEVQAQLERIRPALPDAPPPEAFARRFDQLALVRIAKDVSHYLDAAASRGDQRYLRFVPTALANLKHAALGCAERDDAFAEIAELITGLPADAPAARRDAR